MTRVCIGVEGGTLPTLATQLIQNSFRERVIVK